MSLHDFSENFLMYYFNYYKVVLFSSLSLGRGMGRGCGWKGESVPLFSVALPQCLGTEKIDGTRVLSWLALIVLRSCWFLIAEEVRSSS